MRHLTTVVILLVSFSGYTQTSTKVQTASEPSSTERYLWSLSKNKADNTGKPLIDFAAMDQWRQMGRYVSVSNDGKYFAYTTNKWTGTRYWFSRLDSLIVQSTADSWRMAFAKSKTGFFSGDGRQYIFQNGADLAFLPLGGSQLHMVTNVSAYKTNENNNWIAWIQGRDSLVLQNLANGKQRIFPGIADYDFEKTNEWMVCKSKGKELLLFHLVTNVVRRLSNVEDYAFSANSKGLLVKTAKGVSSSLKYVRLAGAGTVDIFTTEEKQGIGSYSLDGPGTRVLFAVIDSADDNKTAIWYYQEGMQQAICKLNNQAGDFPEGNKINDGVSFTDNGKFIQFQLQAKSEATAKPKEDFAGVEVWGHKDLYLQPAQARHANETATYNAILDSESGKIVFVETSNKKLQSLKGNFALVRNDYKEKEGDRFWEHARYKDSVWILSLKDGSSHLLPSNPQNKYWFSPDGKWLIFFDGANGSHYYGYHLNTGEVKNISTGVPDEQLSIKDHSDVTEQSFKQGNLAAWIDDGSAVLVYDTYDIWKLDLTGKKQAVNLTDGYGQSSNVVFTLFNSDHYAADVPVVKAGDALLLRAFNRINKQNGFYRKSNLNAGAPAQLSMGGYFFNFITGDHDINLSNEGIPPIKAEKNKLWIVQRQSANDAPNYFATTDFKNFKRLTNLQPQAGYNWLTQELHAFKHLDGATGQGVLYKPENFDSTKQYPVVIAFYGGFSSNMYQFRDPAYLVQSMAAGMSPIWFLNNGFLVFTPDIAVTPLKYGPKAYSCIEGAAKYLQQLPYVNGRLAFASHSWSSQLGAYLYTHSTTFSAASITEGMSFGNMISQALTINKRGESYLSGVENGRQSGNLWDNKDAWIDQTTVLNVDKAKAALLLLCNKESSPDYQNQAEQLFVSSRRMNKSAWWLKYDNGDHTLQDLKELKDYNIRYAQFLDHYLRNAPAPRWMTEGVPSKYKAIENRYELDPSHTCGDECLVCIAWNKQYAKNPGMFQKEPKDWELNQDISEELARKQNERRKELDKEGEGRTKEVLKMLAK